VWSFIYANSNEDGVFRDGYQYLLSRFKLSRSSLQRIIEYGCLFTSDDGQKVGRKWADKTLEVIFVTQVSGQKVGRKWADNSSNEPQKNRGTKTKKKAEQKQDGAIQLYKEMISEYDHFCQSRIGMGAKMDALQGKSMKLIISYLQSQVVKKQGELPKEQLDIETLNAWRFILSEWSSVSDFYGQQIKLNQINSNLPNILTQIRNSKKKPRNEKFASTVSQIDGISFGETQQ
jgi:hypothetical protein